MKYPLDKSEWKWLTLTTLMITVFCIGFALIITTITGDDIFRPLTGFVWMLFIYLKIILPVLRRI